MNGLTRKRRKDLGLPELIAIALGGMIGGGIFAILGVSTEYIGNATPIAIIVGGVLALFAAHSYIKLALLYKDEGATYSFYKKTFPSSTFGAAAIGWLVVFGYISTLALYAFTFSSYFCSVFPSIDSYFFNKVIAFVIIATFVLVNLISVKGMGKIEDVMVYAKLIILLFISGLLAGKGDISSMRPLFEEQTTLLGILMISSVTFVSYEGFQLVIHAYDEMEDPKRNIPRAIYIAIAVATILYTALAVGALSTIPKDLIIQDKEYALAAGAKQFLGGFGMYVVIFGALLATSSAISGTLFGASRLMAVIANDGYLPKKLTKKHKVYIPYYAVITMGLLAMVLILSGGLQVILEFGSITFIVVSCIIAYANYVKRKETKTGSLIAICSVLGLLIAGVLIVYFEYKENKTQVIYILSIYAIILLGALFYSKRKNYGSS